MDLFVGKLPPSSRVGPAADHRDPPSWQPGNDLASDRRVDVVFVQFPRRCIEDHSGVWLPAYVPWGIDYILSCADPNQSEHIVINLSYGPTTGPHDGTDLLEAALATYVANYNGNGGKHELEIVVPAGNAYLSDGHVHFKRNVSGDPSQVEWIWRLPPDNTVRCFVEVWMKTAQVGGVNVTLTSPTGVVSPGAPVPWGTSTKWLLEVGPTVATLAAGAREHGDYRIKVTGVGVSAEVHAYAARTDPNLGVRSGAKPSRFIDADWEKNRSPEASHTRVNGEFDRTGSLIHRLGTLNGLATGNANRLRVAGGYVLGRVRGSPYSSAGPARGPLPPRNSPDLALPCDESHALRGMRGGGNRSGSVFRLIGTSAAAPQLARYVAGPPPMIPPAANAPAPGSNDEFKRGAGNLPAP